MSGALISSDLILRNLTLWSLQIAAVTAAATLFSFLAPLRTPGAKLFYWQAVLVTSLALPLLRPWQEHVAATAEIATMSGLKMNVTPGLHAHSFPFTASDTLVWVLVAGIVIRLAWIGAGFLRLGKYRRHSRPLKPGSPWGSEAELLVSDEIGSPVTFGHLKPVVLLPANFATLGSGARDAILCHEILHVRRKDWLFTLAEELVRALLWFHPAIWWQLSEIQLAREQTVDRAVIDTMHARDEYVDALLIVAGASSALDVAPAPLFLRKRHLKQRVVSILKEVRMSKRRTMSTLAAGFALLAASCWFITETLPLQAAPQTVIDGEGISVQMNGAQLMHRPPLAYPREARTKGIQGEVVAQVKTDASGIVVDASILSGPDELRKSVLQSVLGWHFAKESAQATRQVVVGFALPKEVAVQQATPELVTRVPGAQVGVVRASRVASFMPQTDVNSPAVIKSVTVNGLSDVERDRLLQNLPVHAEDAYTPEANARVVAAASEFDEHLTVRFLRGASPSDMNVVISAPDAPPPPPAPGAVRVGARVQAANLLEQVRPAYPPLAKEARVQGVVSFQVTIGKDGAVENLQLLSGPPLLVQSAMDAVHQWTYKPTLLNGQPVEVLTTVDVNFTLAQ